MVKMGGADGKILKYKLKKTKSKIPSQVIFLELP